MRAPVLPAARARGGIRALLLALGLLIGAGGASAQGLLTYVDDILGWSRPAPPVRVVGPLHFVGTRALGCWLIVTERGHILINTGTRQSEPLLKASIAAAGYDWRDIRILLVGHPHRDHAGAVARLRAQTGARLAVMDADAQAMRDGGVSDFHLGRWRLGRFTGAEVDRVLHDGDTVALGGVILTAHKTAGHTPGATTWTASFHEAGRTWKVALVDGTNVNPGYDLVGNRRYPGIAADYRATFARLRRLGPDIFLTHHGWMNDFPRLRLRAARLGLAGWVNGPEYQHWIDTRAQVFERELRRQESAEN